MLELESTINSQKYTHCSDARYAATAGRVAVLPAKPVPWPVRNEERFRMDLARSKVSCVKQRPLSCCW